MKASPLVWILATVFVGVCLGPLAWLAIASVSPDSDIGHSPPELPLHPTWIHYQDVLVRSPFLHYLLNSFAVAGLTTLAACALGTLAAYALALLDFRLRGAFLGGVLLVSMFPQIATVGPLYRAVTLLGLRDTYAALVLSYMTFSLPLAIWILTIFFADLPAELGRAARIDGCTPWQAFVYVALPLVGPGFFTTAILVFVAAWNEFLFALTFTASAASRTVPVGIAMFAGLHSLPWGDIAAASIAVTLPVVAIALAFQRRIVAGLIAGAVKG